MSRARRLGVVLAALVLPLLGLSPLGLSPLAAQDLPAETAALEWLAGRWVGTVDGMASVRRFEAQYTGSQGGVLLGMSKAFGEGDRLLWFEYERFEVSADGLVVTPYPNGRPSVTFKLASYDAAARKAVFVNPEHDFPTEISYQRLDDDRVQLMVAGPTKDGGRSVLAFNLSRQP